ncbi:hypothetical protein CYMTET_38002 [Cymbomonas tetramitiformis]|uniref:protein O-GlcNAc transferase n=1 Tax=Cymbomonas tetramitiformis TaxID=36881 RepID=A0AAE0CCT1_9CHLO|nr:hypothetical protein CYMTET_38002 [Cymbomonas tetramitiformis]
MAYDSLVAPAALFVRQNTARSPLKGKPVDLGVQGFPSIQRDAVAGAVPKFSIQIPQSQQGVHSHHQSQAPSSAQVPFQPTTPTQSVLPQSAVETPRPLTHTAQQPVEITTVATQSLSQPTQQAASSEISASAAPQSSALDFYTSQQLQQSKQADFGAYLELASAYAGKGDTTSAHHYYTEVLRLQPTCAVAWCGIAALYSSTGDHTRALLSYQEALLVHPNCVDAYIGLGAACKELSRSEEAVSCYQIAIQLQPGCARTHAALAGVYFEQGHLELSVACYSDAIALEPNFPEAYNDLGNALRALLRCQEAVQCYTACLQLHAQTAQVHGTTHHLLYSIAVTYNNLASVLKLQNRNDEACACYEHVTRLQPDSAESHANLGNAYKDTARQEQAILAYQQALALKPDYPAALANLVHSLQCVCDWRERKATFHRLEMDIVRQIYSGQPTSVQPFHAMAYPLNANLVLELTRLHARHIELAAERLRVPAFQHPPKNLLKAGQRLKVGYLSSDFGNHPLSHLMGSVFGSHARADVEVTCFALSAADGTEWRKRIEGEVEHFYDVSHLTSVQIATMVNQAGVQVLIDLNGYTKGARNEIFALRPAPVQVSYMGFPATTGARFIDYLVLDRVVAPEHLRHCYSEKLVYMPHCYFVNDYKQAHLDVLDPSTRPSRTEFGLPEDRFIFSCSNQLYKYDPETFTTWCNILRRVPNSVLWLLRFPPFGEPRIKSEAAARGIDPDRIIFTDVADKDVHIKRSGIADLFLDTPMCNAHTTGCDTLWAGCPVITLPLERMASRVCASLCHAAGFGEEMVVGSQSEYEERAVELALSPAKLSDLRSRLCAARLSAHLFDTKEWVRDFERCLLEMWRIYCTEDGPRDFEMSPQVSSQDTCPASASAAPAALQEVEGVPQMLAPTLTKTISSNPALVKALQKQGITPQLLTMHSMLVFALQQQGVSSSAPLYNSVSQQAH